MILENPIFYIIQTKAEKFRPFVGYLVEDDTDFSIWPYAKGPMCDNVEDAQKFIIENSNKADKKYLNPIKSSEMGLSWLAVLITVLCIVIVGESIAQPRCVSRSGYLNTFTRPETPSDTVEPCLPSYAW